MSEAQPKLYLLDVEGTIAPLSLTTDVLFPYARTHFESFLKKSLLDSEPPHLDRAALDEGGQGKGLILREVGKFLKKSLPDSEPLRLDAAEPGEQSLVLDLMLLKLENMNEQDADVPRMWPPGSDPMTTSMSPRAAIPRILAYAYWLMDRDRKSTALKSLQGKIWKAGFESGELKGTLFDDVPEAFRRWSVEARVAIYSSGSVEAQKLFFRHSSHGDLTALISACFDTRTGPKMESGSYAAIAAAMNVAPEELLFFSDSVRELDAAREAGCSTRLVVRPGNAPLEDAHGHSAVESFAAL